MQHSRRGKKFIRNFKADISSASADTENILSLAPTPTNPTAVNPNDTKTKKTQHSSDRHKMTIIYLHNVFIKAEYVRLIVVQMRGRTRQTSF